MTGKITGMMLENDLDTLTPLVANSDASDLTRRIDQATRVLLETAVEMSATTSEVIASVDSPTDESEGVAAAGPLSPPSHDQREGEPRPDSGATSPTGDGMGHHGPPHLSPMPMMGMGGSPMPQMQPGAYGHWPSPQQFGMVPPMHGAHLQHVAPPLSPTDGGMSPRGAAEVPEEGDITRWGAQDALGCESAYQQRAQARPNSGV